MDGSFNHLTYVGIFEDFIEGRLNVGKSFQNLCFNAKGEHKGVALVMFASNLNIVENNPPIPLSKDNKGVYIDGTDILNVDKGSDIPNNYYDIIAVPISYICKHNDKQFEIIGIANSNSKNNKYDMITPYVAGKQKFKRLLIRRRKTTD